jgi:23S rRNA (adenine2503-C2)-methyltransferase
MVWMYHRFVSDFSRMTDLSKELRGKLEEIAIIRDLREKGRKTAPDGTVKFLYETGRGDAIETVLMHERERTTLCLSSQVGCALNCAFCATGKMGFTRHLTAGEMVDQVIQAQKAFPGHKITHAVAMGMGEPFLNYEAVIKAVRLLNAELGLGLGARRITLSTVGIIPGIRRLAEEPLQVKLAVSLNAPTQALREKLMPIARKYPLDKLLSAVQQYTERTGKMMTFEYVLLAGVNDTLVHAKQLADLVKGLLCKINLIPFNPFPGSEYARPSSERVERFQAFLYPRCRAVTLRMSKGREILAGCGQLRAERG